MRIASEQLKDLLLDDSSLGLEFGTNLFIGKEIENSELPNVTIYDVPGSLPTTDIAQIAEYRYDKLQIVVRASSYIQASQYAETLFNFIRELIHVPDPEDSGCELSLFCTQSPFLLEYDEKNRPKFILNLNIERSKQL